MYRKAQPVSRLTVATGDYLTVKIVRMPRCPSLLSRHDEHLLTLQRSIFILDPFGTVLLILPLPRQQQRLGHDNMSLLQYNCPSKKENGCIFTLNSLRLVQNKIYVRPCADNCFV